MRALENKLREAKAKLRGDQSTIPAAEVRAWAASAGVPHPTHGPVPHALVNQYLAAKEAS